MDASRQDNEQRTVAELWLSIDIHSAMRHSAVTFHTLSRFCPFTPSVPLFASFAPSHPSTRESHFTMASPLFRSASAQWVGRSAIPRAGLSPRIRTAMATVRGIPASPAMAWRPVLCSSSSSLFHTSASRGAADPGTLLDFLLTLRVERIHIRSVSL